jgi:two-component system sensor kinase FixL
MLGYDPEDMAGRDTWGFTHPDDRAHDAELLEAAISREGASLLREKRYLRHDGESVWCRVSTAVIRSLDDGTPTMTVSVIENIDKHYKAQKALETAKGELEQALAERTEALDQVSYREAMLTLILETGPDAIIVSDASGMISRFSAAAERIFGWSEAEMIGQHVGLIMPEQFSSQDDADGRALQAAPLEIVGKSREVVGKRRDGSRFPMMLHVGELRIGGVRHVTEFVRDLTDVREANDRAQGLQAQLNHLWSLNSLGEMAAVLAHELNQPLTAIVNYVEGARALLVRMELEDETILEAIEKTSDQAIRAGEIIRRMRSIIDKNESTRCLEDLRDVVTEVDFMVSLVSRESGVTVLYNLATDVADIYADRVQIQQVILNFVRNAVEAMRHHQTRIMEITTRLDDGFWAVGVEDSGPGVSPDIAERLFLPMNSTKAHGMGLGLSLSKAIVENHGGAIWAAESRLGGAGFWFKLPVARKN